MANGTGTLSAQYSNHEQSKNASTDVRNTTVLGTDPFTFMGLTLTGTH
jgi:hypothetical protein